MGKAPNGLGKFSGKVGGVVFAISNGEQIVRAYQPVVNNPKSSGQQNQRAKGNLVGRISQIVPWQILEGMGRNRRERRGNFLRVALNRTTATPSVGNPNIIDAVLLDQDFIFSQGAVTPTMGVTTAAATSTRVSITMSKLDGVSQEDFDASGALVVAVTKGNDGKYEQVLYRFVSPEEFGGQNTFAFNMNHFAEGAYNVAVYIAPFKTTDGAALRTKTEQLTGNATGLHALLVNNPSAIVMDWGNSVFSTTTSYTPAG